MKYDAFISYRHTPIDMEVAKLIHTELEKYRVPRSVQKSSGKKRINRVFRDQEELPIGNNLTNNITMAIEESEFLIVICSTRTKESEWVAKEIDIFIEMHGRNNVMAVLVDGSSQESFPPALLVDVNGNPAEPLAADIRGVDGKARKKKLKTELLRLAAPILHCNYDDLRQRHRERRIKSIAAIACTIASAVAVAGIGFAFYNAAMAKKIQKNYEAALMNQSRYLADTSLSLAEDGDREAAVMVALEALGRTENSVKRPYVAQAEYALSNALGTYDNGNTISKDRLLKHQLPVRNLKYCNDGQYIMSDDEGGTVYLWDVSDGRLITSIDGAVSSDEYISYPYDYSMYKDGIIICAGEQISGHSMDNDASWYAPVGDKVTDMKLYSDYGFAVCVLGNEISIFDLEKHDFTRTVASPEEDSTYSSDIEYCDDTKELYIARHNLTEKPAVIDIIDMNTGEIKSSIPVKGDTVNELKYSGNHDVVVVSCDYDDIVKSSDNCYTAYLEVLDHDTGECIWEWEHESNNKILNAGKTILKVRSIDSSKYGKCSQVILSMGDDVYTFDLSNGEEQCYVRTPENVVQMLVSASADLGYLGEGNGTIEIVNLSTGESYPEAAIETGRELRDMIINKGVIASKGYRSQDIMLLKYTAGANMETIIEMADSVRSITASPDGSILAVEHGGFGNETYAFYDNSGKLLFDYSSDEVSPDGTYTTSSAFISDECFLWARDFGRIEMINPVKGEVETFASELTGLEGFSRSYVTDNGRYLVVGDAYNAVVIDLKNKKNIFATKDEAILFFGYEIISEDGKSLYILNNKNGVNRVDIDTGKMSVLPAEFRAAASVGTKTVACINREGTRFAMFCEDGCLRIYDTVSGTTVASIPETGRNNTYICFNNDGTKLIYQGDDMYVKILDVESGQVEYISERQHNTILYQNETADGRICIITEAGMLVLDRDSFVPVAYVPSGAGYLVVDNSIVSYHGDDVYKFPFQTVDGLIEEADKLFPDMEISDELRLRYHVNQNN